MFGDIVKFGIRSVAVLGIIGAILGVFAVVTLPSPDYSVFATMIGKGYAFMVHWVPGFQALWNVFTAVFGLWLIMKTLQFSIYASSIVLKIFK